MKKNNFPARNDQKRIEEDFRWVWSGISGNLPESGNSWRTSPLQSPWNRPLMNNSSPSFPTPWMLPDMIILFQRLYRFLQVHRRCFYSLSTSSGTNQPESIDYLPINKTKANRSLWSRASGESIVRKSSTYNSRKSLILTHGDSIPLVEQIKNNLIIAVSWKK